MKMFAVVIDSKTIRRSCGSVCNAGKITAFLALEQVKCPPGVFLCAFFQDNIEPVRLGRPNTKMRFVRLDQFRADRVTTADVRLSHASLSFVSCGLALRFGDFSFPF